jgi:NADP-dependent 3-hydroxy acid dehydrogenase YdfG
VPNWSQDLEGVRALVIGASSGIGEAVAVAAHARGARVCVAARRVDRLKRLSKSVGGSAHELDVSDPAAIEEVLRAVVTHLGGLDALVYTSAVVPFARIEETDSTTWMNAFAVNAVGASHVMRAAAPYFAHDAVALVKLPRATRPDVRG